MKGLGHRPAMIGRVWSLAIALLLVLSALPAFDSPVDAQETVSITVNTTDADGVTPKPFTRVRATSSDGTVYGPRETGLSGTVTFQVDLTSPEMTVTVDVETPPACGVAPDPQVVGPFTAGEVVQVNLAVGTEPNCDLGTLAVYAYDCPDGFDASATNFEAWRDGCVEERNNVEFTFTMVSSGQTWNPVTGQWGIAGRAPIVGLPPGAYTLQETNPASGMDSVFYCYTYATPDYVTSPNPTSIERVDAPGGVATVNLNGNRISCDVFQVEAVQEPGDDTGDDQGPNDGPTDTPGEVTGTATTTSDVNLRDAPDANSNVIVVLPGGVEVGLLGDPQNGFYPVRVNGQDGWVSGDFLQLEDATDEPEETTVPEPTATEDQTITPAEPVGTAIVTSDVNFRDAPDVNSNVMGVLQQGAEVEILGDQQNGFYPVRANGVDGWVSADFLDLDGTSPADETETPGPTATATEFPITIPDTPLATALTNDSVNFRNGPSSEAAILLELPAGAVVDILGDPVNGFYPVRYQNQTGWVSEIFLDIETATETATSSPTQTPEVLAPIGIAFTTSEVNMRAAADAAATVLTVLPSNIQVEILGPETNGFLPVRYNNVDGFVSAQFLSIGAPPSPTATSTQESDVGVADEAPVRVELHKSVCEPGYIPGDGAAIFEDCHAEGLADVTFFVTGPESFSTQGTTVREGGIGPGIVVFEDLPAGTLTINEDVPGDTTSIWVYCSVADGDEVVPFTYNDAIQGIDITLAAGDSIVCDWYNIPDDQGEPEGFLEFHKAACDAGYIPGDSIREDCHGNGLEDITFFIEGPNGYSNQGVTTIPQTPGPGIVRFDNLEAGVYTVNEDVPGDVTSIFVHCELADSPDVVPFTYIDDIQGIQIELTEGMQVICDWYNIPDVQGADEGTASIEMHKALCPPGFEPGTGIYEACHGQGLAGVDFTVNGPNGYSQIGSTVIVQTPGPGTVTFGSLQAGTYSISEDFSGGDYSIYVYCSLANSDQVVPFTYQNGGIDIQLFDGQAVICDWYNIPPADDDGSVEVLKRTCPVGYDDEAANFNDFFNDCMSITNDVTFVLTPDGGSGISRETGDDGNGRAFFSGLGLGGFTLFEDVPGEFVKMYAYCGPDDRNLSAVPVTNGAVDLELTSQNPAAVCLFFNVPEDLSGLTGQISLTKFLCPEGTTSNYWQNCSDKLLSGATFHLNGPGENDGSLVTGNNGTVVFDDLPAGNYTIQEVPPAGTQVAVYVVACQAGGAAYKFTYDDSNGMKIKLNLPIEGEIHCNWYNIPPKKHLPPPPVSTGKGTITVHKFLCTGKPINQYDWENDCLVQTSPEGFSLSNLAGTRLAQGTTNTNGIIVFTGLANGSYKLDETTGDWCYAEADFVDAAGNVIVKNGGNTDVFIYNCGARQVGTLPVTGSGDTAIGNATADLFMPAAGAVATLIVLAGLTAMQRRPRRYDA